MMSIFTSVHAESNEITDLNKITEIYFYEGHYSMTSKEIQQTILYLTTIFGEKFTDENFDYLEKNLLDNKEFKGELALEFYLKLGKSETHQPRILDFIQHKFNLLTENQQKQTVLILMESFPKNEVAKNILKNSRLKNLDLIYGENNTRKKKSWWKFW